MEAAEEKQTNGSLIDPIDRISHMVSWLHALIDLFETERSGSYVRFTPDGFDGFQLMLMHITDTINQAKEEIYDNFKSLKCQEGNEAPLERRD